MTPRGQNRTKTKRHSTVGETVKRWFFLAGLGIVTIFGFLGLFGKNGVLDIVHLKSLHRGLQGEISNLQEKQNQLRNEIARLNDPRYVEFLARERLGLMRPNEVFLVLDEKETKGKY